MHGAAAPQVKAKAEERVAKAEVQAMFPHSQSPADALLDEIATRRMEVASYRLLVDELGYKQTIRGQVIREDISVEWKVYQDSLSSLDNLIRLGITAGIEAARIEADRQIADRFVSVIETALANMKFDNHVEKEFRQIVARELRSIQ